MEAIWYEQNVEDGTEAVLFAHTDGGKNIPGTDHLLICRDIDSGEIFARFRGPFESLLVKGMEFVLGKVVIP